MQEDLATELKNLINQTKKYINENQQLILDCRRQISEVYILLQDCHRQLLETYRLLQTCNKEHQDISSYCSQNQQFEILTLDTIRSLNTLYRYTNDIIISHDAKGWLKISQQAQAKMLSLFTQIAKHFNLNLIASGGTVLGIVRHQNKFVPWDDDIDADMPLQDWLKFIDILDKILPNSGFSFSVDTAIRIYYKQRIFDYIPRNNNQNIAALKLDVHGLMPVETVLGKKKLEDVIMDIQKKEMIYDRELTKKPVYDKNTLKKILDLHQHVIKNIKLNNEKNMTYTIYPSTLSVLRKIPFYNNLFPPRKTNLCGFPVNIPNNAIGYLIQIYGDYKSIPLVLSSQHYYEQNYQKSDYDAWKEFLNTPNEYYIKSILGKA